VLQDYKLGVRMLLKYPGLTLAGGLALAIAIGVGAGYYDLIGKAMAPTIPLPEGDQLVVIETQNTLTSEPEPRVVRDFLEWRRELRTIEDLGAYRADTRNLVVAGAAPEPIQSVQITAAAFRTAGVSPLLGRPLLESDERPGAPGVIVLGFDVWQRALGGRPEVVGSIVRLGITPSRVELQPVAATEGSANTWYEIVGVVRDLGLDPDDEGHEVPFVFHPASAETVSALMMHVPVRGNAAALAARLPVIATDVDARLAVRKTQPLDAWIRKRDISLAMQAGAFAGVTLLILFLSALGIFSLVSVSVSRRTREIGLRAALGANPRHLLAGILSRAVVLMGSGIAAGGAFLMLFLAAGGGPTSRPADDVVLFSGYLALTAAVMLSACLLACIGPASRALRINPMDALREA
jgi:hypothetical protein